MSVPGFLIDTGTFGDYTSFLEIAFGTNLLIGVLLQYRSLWSKMLRRYLWEFSVPFHAEANEGNTNSLTTSLLEDIDKTGKSYEEKVAATNKRYIKAGLGAMIVIAVLLLLIENDVEVSWWPPIVFVLLGVPFPVAVFRLFSHVKLMKKDLNNRYGTVRGSLEEKQIAKKKDEKEIRDHLSLKEQQSQSKVGTCRQTDASDDA